MTAEIFRRLAVSFPGAEEKSHAGKADFRVRNKIFASLPDAATGTVKLTPEQQELMLSAEPDLFSPAAGAWGRQGWTRIALVKAGEATIRSALRMAWTNVTGKPPPA